MIKGKFFKESATTVHEEGHVYLQSKDPRRTQSPESQSRQRRDAWGDCDSQAGVSLTELRVA